MPQSERFRIQEIMGNRVRYCVPSFYQRSYVWTLEKQWEDLWADILRKTNELISAENKLKDDPSFKPRIANHFMGAFVVNAVLSYGFNPPRKDVIDGQQRLTTIQLLIHAFSHVAALIFGQDSQLVSQLDVYTRNINAKDEYEFKVWPTEADQALFSKMLKSKSQGEVMQKLGLDTPSIAKNQKQKSTGIDGAYFYFYDEILAYIRNNSDSKEESAEITMQERANKLYEVIIQRMDLVMIELNEYDDPQVIFEALNGRGTPLLPSDLIKNHIFETIRPFCIDQDPMPYYHEFWNFFDSKNEAIQDVESENPPKFWKKEVKQGRLFRPRIDLFLFHYLQCKRAGEVSISELFREFKDWWVSQPHDTLGEITRNLSDLKLYAGFFEKFLTAKREDGDIETRLWRFRSIDTGTIYPVLLFLFSESECNPSKIDKASLPLLLADMESYLVRRGVCGLTGKNYNKIFIKLLGDLRELISVDSHAIGRLLVKGKDTTNSFPTDEEFKRAWLSRSIYSPGLSSFINMILASINEAMRTDAQERAFIEYAGLSVEHVMPRGWREYWPLADGDKTHHEDPISRLPVTNQQWRESQIDTIGNLTLLTSKLNEKISNGPFENSERPTDKRREYKKHTLLRITQMIANRDHWNEQEIQDRANRLFEYAVKIWPYPNM